MLKKLMAVAWFLVPVAVVAQAVVPDPDTQLVEFFKLIIGAFQSGQWSALFVLGLVLVVYLVRKFAVKIPKVGAFFETSAGGTLLSVVTSAVTLLAAAVVGGTPITLGLIGKVAVGAAAAIGGWNGIRRLVPLLAMIPVIGKYVGWLVPKDIGERVAAETTAAFKPTSATATQAEEDLFK